MVDTSSIVAPISGIGGGRLQHRCPNFRHRWWTPPASLPQFPASVVDTSSIVTPISGVDGGRLQHRCLNFWHRWWTLPSSHLIVMRRRPAAPLS
jgi:hypothetical protein